MAENIDIISDEDLQAPLDLATNYRKLANDYDAVVASTTLLMSKLESQDVSIAQLTAHTKQLEKETKKLEDVNKKAAKSTQSMAAATDLADDATGGLVSRTKQLGKQLFALLANPVVAFFAAIAVALSSVAVYFKSTNEGADKFERIMAALNGIVDFLTNKFAKLGEQIVKLFEDGNVVGEAFMWVFERVINIISGAIDTFTNLLKIVNILSQYSLKEIFTGKLKPEDIKELRKVVIDLGKSAVQAFTGIGTAADEAAAKVKALDSLVQAGQQLADQIRDRILGKAKAELQIEKLLFEAKDKSLKTGESQLENDNRRLAALKQAVKISEDQLKIDLDIAVRKERQYTADLLFKKDIIKSDKESNAVLANGTTLLQNQALERLASDEQLEERKKLEADVFNLQRQYFAENKKSISQIAALEEDILNTRIKSAQIQTDARVKAFDAELAASKKIEGREIIGAKSVLEEKASLHKNFNQRLEDDAKAQEEAEKERQKRITEALKEQEAKRRLIRESAIVAVGMIGDEIFDRRQERLAEEAKQVEVQRAADLQAAGHDERKKLAINRKADREQAKIKTKQAQAEKSSAMFGIIINTALGIMKAAPVVPLMIATGILGAIQLALVASKPIPKFATGTDNSPSTFIAGEKGRELVSHKGRLTMADRATLFTGMAGSRVFSNPATEEILGDIGDVGHALSYGARNRRVAQENYVIADRLQESNKWLQHIAKNGNGDVVIVDNFGDNRYHNRVARRNSRINRRFRG